MIWLQTVHQGPLQTATSAYLPQGMTTPEYPSFLSTTVQHILSNKSTKDQVQMPRALMKSSLTTITTYMPPPAFPIFLPCFYFSLEHFTYGHVIYFVSFSFSSFLTMCQLPEIIKKL